MPHPVATLLLRCPPGIPGIYTFNGITAGEVGESCDMLQFPLTPNAVCAITFTPLVSPPGTLLFPVTRTLRFSNGTLEDPAYPMDHIRIVLWPQSIFEVTLEPLGLDVPCVPHIDEPFDFSWDGLAYSAFLTNEGQKRHLLICNEEGCLVFDHPLPGEEALSFSHESLDANAPSMLIVRSESYLLAVSRRGNTFTCACELHADEILTHPLRTRQEIKDTARHTIETQYVYESGRFCAKEVRSLSASEIFQNSSDTVRAFCEAAQVSLFDEAFSLLAPSLASELTPESIRLFLGEFIQIESQNFPVPEGALHAIGLRYRVRPCVEQIRIYGFSLAQDNGVWQITELWEV